MAETRKQLIEWLETGQREFAHYAPEDKELFGNLPALSRKFGEIARLLKAQEPRVMTYDELVTFDGAFLLESCNILSELDWVFFFDTDSKSDAIWVEGFDGERCVVYREDYDQYARCWTSRPTDEQMEATAWQKPGNG